MWTRPCLPVDIYSLVNHHRVAKDLWERVQLLMQGTYLTKQERECKLYDAFDKFTHIKGESLHTYYLRFTQLINDMNIYKMKMEQFQVNTKFLNSLPPEWSKFVTDAMLLKFCILNFVQSLCIIFEQHELHAKMKSLRGFTTSGIGQGLLSCYNCQGEGIWLGNASADATRNAHGTRRKAILEEAQWVYPISCTGSILGSG
ncbi:hypothetical protein Tco_1262630 [Tanacetum coccineum]